jgi:hypothetical protein
VLKMLAPGGVLTLQANLAIAYACERESLALAEVIDLTARMQASLAESKKVPEDDLCATTSVPLANARKHGAGIHCEKASQWQSSLPRPIKRDTGRLSTTTSCNQACLAPPWSAPISFLLYSSVKLVARPISSLKHQSTMVSSS